MPTQHIAEVLAPAVVALDKTAAHRQGKTVIQTIADAGGWTAPEEGSERYRALAHALASRGAPYSHGGRTYEHGGQTFIHHDAWSLARACATVATERDCIDVERPGPSWGIDPDEARKALTQWGLSEVKLRHAAPGDLLLFDMPAEGQTAGGFHIAVMSAPGGDLSWAMLPGRKLPEPRLIHGYCGKGVGECWLGPFWAGKLVAAFSFETPGSPLRAAAKAAA